jgi:DNA-binding transcriptional ArsR family regulator
MTDEQFSYYQDLSEERKIRWLRSELTKYSNFSIPPEETLGIGMAETNTIGVSWQDFIAQEQTDSEPWLINGLLRSGWLVVLGGHGKHGKSTLAVHLLNRIRAGGAFVSQCSKAPVIYLNCEMAVQDARELVRDVISNSPAEECESAQIINEIKLPLDLPWLELFLEKQPKSGACVIDSFRGAFLLSGDTENQAGTVGGILRRLQLIARKTKWTIILIHHFRKSGTGEALDLAGSGEWLSAPDAIFTWSCLNFKEPGILNVIGRIAPQDPLSIQLTRTNVEFLGTTAEHQIEAEKVKVLASLTDEGISSENLAKLIQLPPSTVRRHLDSLYSAGNIEREGEGKKGSAYLWKSKITQQRCGACGGTDFWQREDGGLICSICHPMP